MNYFFTADTHFGHTNIIKYCNRPFKSIQEMDSELIKRWNSKITDKDIVFHLGDFCFGNNDHDFDKYFSQLNGKIVWIKGNHDELAWKNRDKFQTYSSGYYEAKIDNQSIVLCHYAMLVWNKSHFGTWHLYGHSHGTLPDNLNSMSMDCGVDTNNYYPYSFAEIAKRMSKKTFVPIDHHTGNK
jgi:calcineurin-like phosphoesterase family protein